MSRTTVDTVAAAVVRRLQAQGQRAAPRAALTGSIAAPLLASAGRGRNAAAPSIDMLANKLASAVSRRLATGQAAPGIPLAASRLTKAIVRNVTRQLGKSLGAEPVALSTIDPAAAARALTGALNTRQATSDPAAIVASSMMRHLNAVRLVGTPADARLFQDRVASIVTASLRSTQAEATAATVEDPAAVPAAAPADTPAEPAASDSTGTAAPTSRKRD